MQRRRAYGGHLEAELALQAYSSPKSQRAYVAMARRVERRRQVLIWPCCPSTCKRLGSKKRAA